MNAIGLGAGGLMVEGIYAIVRGWQLEEQAVGTWCGANSVWRGLKRWRQRRGRSEPVSIGARKATHKNDAFHDAFPAA